MILYRSVDTCYNTGDLLSFQFKAGCFPYNTLATVEKCDTTGCFPIDEIPLESGEYSLILDADNFPNGSYYLSFVLGDNELLQTEVFFVTSANCKYCQALEITT